MRVSLSSVRPSSAAYTLGLDASRLFFLARHRPEPRHVESDRSKMALANSKNAAAYVPKPKGRMRQDKAEDMWVDMASTTETRVARSARQIAVNNDFRTM